MTAQSFEDAHRGKVCVRAFIRVGVCSGGPRTGSGPRRTRPRPGQPSLTVAFTIATVLKYTKEIGLTPQAAAPFCLGLESAHACMQPNIRCHDKILYASNQTTHKHRILSCIFNQSSVSLSRFSSLNQALLRK